MLDIEEATQIVKSYLPDGKIQVAVPYQNVYLFQVFGDDPLEGRMDPFFSVDKTTGEFRDFSVLTDGDISEIAQLFLDAKGGKRE